MPAVTGDVLARMENLLKSGPILVGETHTSPFARSAVINLMDRGAVKFLSVELPVGHPVHSRADGQFDTRGQLNPRADRMNRYFSKVDEMANPQLSLQDVAKHAMGKKIPVYFHDMPHKFSRLRQLDAPGSNYVQNAQRYGGGLPRTPDQLSNMLVQRNQYTKAFLQENLGKGVKVLFGLVVLAGDHHLLDNQCSGKTIQALLGVAPGRVFHCN